LEDCPVYHSINCAVNWGLDILLGNFGEKYIKAYREWEGK